MMIERERENELLASIFEQMHQIATNSQQVAVLTLERNKLRQLLTEATEWADNQLGPYDTPEEWFVEARRMLKNSGGRDD